MNETEKKAKKISDKIDLLEDSILFSDVKIDEAISSLEEMEEIGNTDKESIRLLVREVKTHYRRICLDRKELEKIERELGLSS